MLMITSRHLDYYFLYTPSKNDPDSLLSYLCVYNTSIMLPVIGGLPSYKFHSYFCGAL